MEEVAMHRFVQFAAAMGLMGLVLAACGTEGPGEESAPVSEQAQGGAASDGGASAEGGAGETSAPDDDDDGGAGASDSSSGGEPPPTCSIMSSNISCKSCLEENCCMVVHACLDEDLLGCVSCLDCYLSGGGPECCDESVGKNDWLAECIAFNCLDAC
jgi:hypothetical protein